MMSSCAASKTSFHSTEESKPYTVIMRVFIFGVVFNKNYNYYRIL